MSADVTVVWDERLLGYDFGDHPLNPARVELTIELARELGVLDRPNVTVAKPEPAPDWMIELLHEPRYVSAVKAAPYDPFVRGHGLNTPDNPVFFDMHEASALVAGASVLAAEQVWSGRADHAVNLAGGLHHAMRNQASGFCIYNDVAIAIRRLLDGGAQRVAYVDVDAHHGDGVQAAFWNEPRVLTISLHESPYTLFPGTGFPHEIGGPDAEGTAVNVALPSGTRDGGWLRAFHAVVPSLLRQFGPEVIVSQCGCDSHTVDPLTDLDLTIDGQRTAYAAMHRLAHELCGGRWVVLGGGGYGLADVVPRAWTHLLAEVTGAPIAPATPIPAAWQNVVRRRFPQLQAPTTMTDIGDQPRWTPWTPGESDALDRAIEATRTAVFPLYGLDPLDPRD